MLPIITTNNPILIKAAQPVEKFDKKLQEILEEMKKALLAAKDPVGVGLAANQIGIPLKIFLAKTTEKSKILTFINPEIVKRRPELVSGQIPLSQSPKQSPKPQRKRLLEGCLSIPSIWGNVHRQREITLSYQDESGKKYTKTFKGFLATIIQHEMDHLNGVLFTKRVMEQGEKLYRSHKNEEGEDEFVEIKL